jgi:hypothetical protein
MTRIRARALAKNLAPHVKYGECHSSLLREATNSGWSQIKELNMRNSFILHIGTLALVLTVVTASIVPAFAASASDARDQSNQFQTSQTGPYDGADFDAATRAFK